MACKTIHLIYTLVFLLYLTNADYTQAASFDVGDNRNSKSSSSIFVDDVVVESTLSVRRKAGNRQGRTGPGIETKPSDTSFPKKVDGSTFLELKRSKRQSRRRYPGGFPQQGFGNNQQGFPQFQPFSGSASNAQAQAQAFQANSPFGGFGASAANAGSQGFSFNENGFQANAGLSGSQSYNLPNGNTLAFSYSNGFNIGPDGRPTITKGNSLAYTGADGKPISNFQ